MALAAYFASEEKEKDKESDPYLCYLIQCPTGRCYVGMTNNFCRRLRQHNGDIKGGAKRTRNRGPWRPVVTVHGFDNKIQALQFEWAWQKARPRKWSMLGWLERLQTVMRRRRWTGNAPLASTVPLFLHVHKRNVCLLHLQLGCVIEDKSQEYEGSDKTWVVRGEPATVAMETK